MTHPAGIVASMRAGASEYIDSSAGSDALLDALTRYKFSGKRAFAGRARVFTFLVKRNNNDDV